MMNDQVRGWVRRGKRIQIRAVVRMAAIVPMGMDFCASLKSPDLLEPAMMPVHKQLHHPLFLTISGSVNIPVTEG